MKAKILILVSFLIVLSCNKNKKTNETEAFCFSPNSHSTQEEEWIKKILCYGDTLAYQTMFDYYSDDSHLDEFLGYSVIMANKYDYPQAYYDVFNILMMFTNFEEYSDDFVFYCLDNKTQQMALTFFREAIYKGNIYASERLLNEFDKGKSFAIEDLYLDRNLIDKAKQNVNRYK